mmetsp:Transcript_11830/g.16216  ORF Transcript_11830/g.16216 Transcript_11830/m.16216 type:complete len:126 (-) Transcript_11830:51-428(-)
MDNQLSTVIINPFSFNDFNLGGGGTFPTQDLIFCPAIVTVQTPHSPFLQLVGTFNPSLRHAAIKLDPPSTSSLFPVDVTKGVFSTILRFLVLKNGETVQRINPWTPPLPRVAMINNTMKIVIFNC